MKQDYEPDKAKQDRELLIRAAVAARQNAYAPYSHFRVGAALIDDRGHCHTGCNIENASYGATCCAERTAVFKAISEGAQRIRRLAVVSDQAELCMPCGICRQVMAEFARWMIFYCWLPHRNGSIQDHLHWKNCCLPISSCLKPQKKAPVILAMRKSTGSMGQDPVRTSICFAADGD